eukprot:SAG11_NODE_252_length_11593_cov_7.436663_9_plen_156_part_00
MGGRQIEDSRGGEAGCCGGGHGGWQALSCIGGAIWEEKRRSWLQTNGEKVVILTGEGNQRRFVWLREVWDDAAAQCIAEKQCIASQLSLVNFVARLSFSDLLVHCGPGSTLAVGEKLIEHGFGAARWPSVEVRGSGDRSRGTGSKCTTTHCAPAT